MKASEITDCSECPLEDTDYCKGMTSGAGGISIEPPCTSWKGDEEIGIEEYEHKKVSYERYLDKIQKEKDAKEKKKKDILQKRRNSYFLNYAENKEITKLRRIIRNLEKQKSFVGSIPAAFNITNNMMQTGRKVNMDFSEINNLIDEYKLRIEKLKKIKKEKLKNK